MYRKGFTLVELLVVVAIISILAAMVVPRVTNWIDRSRMARAAGEIRNMDLALTKMLADADKKNFSKFIDPNWTSTWNEALRLAWVANIQNSYKAYQLYSDFFYELLRRGKNADLSFFATQSLIAPALDPNVKRKLGTSYMEIGPDPWGNPYQFFAGPIPTVQNIYFRAYRFNDGSPYYYDQDAKDDADEQIRGNPPADNFPGYPAPNDLPVYIWSIGGNEEPEQMFGNTQAVIGDDINNWDNQTGWSEFY